jgi:hypothetical protein
VLEFVLSLLLLMHTVALQSAAVRTVTYIQLPAVQSCIVTHNAVCALTVHENVVVCSNTVHCPVAEACIASSTSVDISIV